MSLRLLRFSFLLWFVLFLFMHFTHAQLLLGLSAARFMCVWIIQDSQISLSHCQSLHPACFSLGLGLGLLSRVVDRTEGLIVNL